MNRAHGTCVCVCVCDGVRPCKIGPTLHISKLCDCSPKAADLGDVSLFIQIRNAFILFNPTQKTLRQLPRFLSKKKNMSKGKKTKKCYYCNKTSHSSSDCPDVIALTDEDEDDEGEEEDNAPEITNIVRQYKQQRQQQSKKLASAAAKSKDDEGSGEKLSSSKKRPAPSSTVSNKKKQVKEDNTPGIYIYI